MKSLSGEKKSVASKCLVLGTALWGWGVDKREAFQVLDYFVENGGSLIDVATNYPINKIPSDYGLALEYISDWISSRRYKDLQVILKLGAVDNLGSSQFDLSRGRIEVIVEEAHNKLNESLKCVSVHWDNRGQTLEDHAGIEETANVLQELNSKGFEIGLSGIKNPAAYQKFLGVCSENLWIQVKENLLTRGARENYEHFFPNANYLAYGLNMGGLKIEKYRPESSKELRNITYPAWLANSVKSFLVDNELYPKVRSVSDLTLFHAFCNDKLSGIIIGPRTQFQLREAFEFWNRLIDVRPKQNSRQLESSIFGV